MKLNWNIPLGLGIIAALFSLSASAYSIYLNGLSFKDGFFFIFGICLISLAMYLLVVPVKESGISEFE